MDDAPPPTDHVLRPHHVALLTIFILTFKELDSKAIPSLFTLHLYRELLKEVSEVCPIDANTNVLIYLMILQVARPKSHSELLYALNQGPMADAEGSRRLIASFQVVVRAKYLLKNLFPFLLPSSTQN
jgi:hypothetical protein